MPRKTVRFALLVSALALVSALPALGRGHVRAASAQSGSLHDVDWDAQLAQDFPPPGDECIPPPPGFNLGPCVYVPLAESQPVNGLGGSGPAMGFAGYADTADVLYADLDGDGQDEAVIRTESTGTGGSFGFLVYHQTALGPQAVVTYPGYKLAVGIESGVLSVTEPYYFGFEANCCPTGLIVHAYLLGDAGLYDVSEPRYVLLGTGGEIPANPAMLTVAAFYHALNNQSFDAAYALLSPEGRARKSFDDFKAGYATTQSVDVSVAPGAGIDEVLVRITSVDAGPGGMTVTKHFAGSWFVSYDPAAPLGVFLARASIQEMD